jgi:hypothetical protein
MASTQQRMSTADNRRFLWTAFILLPLALFCDVMDGYVARLNKKRQSVLGADQDCAADGHARAHLLRHMRRQPAGALQQRDREGEIFEGTPTRAL